MTTLAYLDQVTGGTLSGGKQWVGTGTISPKGQVGPIGMTKTKLEGAANDGYRTFFLPIQNVDEVSTYAHQLDVTLIPVSSLAQAVSYLCQNGGTGPACQHIPKTQEFTYELLP